MNGMLGCCGAMSLGPLLALVGWHCLGTAGAIGGALTGTIAGASLGVLYGSLLDRLGIVAERRARQRTLGPIFGKYWSANRRADWESVVAARREGDPLSGRVVATFYYGVALDVGIGFPAILTKLRYQTPFSDDPPLGCEVAGRIDQIDGAGRTIWLTQGQTHAEIVEELRSRESNHDPVPQADGRRT